MKVLRLFFLFTLIVISIHAEAKLLCAEIFPSRELVRGDEILFTQEAIGKRWAERKIEVLQQDFHQATQAKPGLTKKAFLQSLFQAKPTLAIRDWQNRVRIIDNHHKFFAISKFYGREMNFPITLQIVRDYSAPRVKDGRFEAWKPEQSLRDMYKMGFVGKVEGGRPTVAWLEQLPQRASDLGDLPLRSLMSFVLLSFPTPLKGSDFKPHIQNQLARVLRKKGVDLFSKDTFGVDNIGRIQMQIRETPELVDFLIDRLQPNEAKTESIIKMLDRDS